MESEGNIYRVYSFVDEWRRANPVGNRQTTIELDYEDIFERVLREHEENHIDPAEKPIGIEVHPEIFMGFQKQCQNTYLTFPVDNGKIMSGLVQWHGLKISERGSARPFEIWLQLPNLAGHDRNGL